MSAKKQAKDAATDTFEQLMKRIGEITATLEKGDRPLDESIALFEEGMRLFKTCQRKLDDAERKVSVLVKQDGQEHEQPFSFDAKQPSNGDEP